MIQKKTKGAMLLCAAVLCCSFGLAACAPHAPEQSSDAAEGGNDPSAVAVEFAWSEQSDCAMCHAEESASFDDATYGASYHKSDATCQSCHTQAAELAAAHEGATPEKAERAVLKATSVQSAVCESCHDLAEIAEKTAGVTTLTDANGVVANPHGLSESESHDELSCTSCHQMHVADANIEKKAQRACASCHHANVYECYTCHS